MFYLFVFGLLLVLIGLAMSSLCLAIGGYLANPKQAWQWNIGMMGVGLLLMLLGH